MRPFLVVFAAFALLACSAVAGEPSSACRAGAAPCADAWTKLDACQQANAGKDGACQAEKSAADTACQADDSACDRDGSRSPPARAGRT